MKQIETSNEPELATGWPLGMVETCLGAADKDSLVSMIQQRYEERFLEPIRFLKSAPRQDASQDFLLRRIGQYVRC